MFYLLSQGHNVNTESSVNFSRHLFMFLHIVILITSKSLKVCDGILQSGLFYRLTQLTAYLARRRVSY